jgi:hypothetical protein
MRGRPIHLQSSLGASDHDVAEIGNSSWSSRSRPPAVPRLAFGKSVFQAASPKAVPPQKPGGIVGEGTVGSAAVRHNFSVSVELGRCELDELLALEDRPENVK